MPEDSLQKPPGYFREKTGTSPFKLPYDGILFENHPVETAGRHKHANQNQTNPHPDPFRPSGLRACLRAALSDGGFGFSQYGSRHLCIRVWHLAETSDLSGLQNPPAGRRTHRQCLQDQYLRNRFGNYRRFAREYHDGTCHGAANAEIPEHPVHLCAVDHAVQWRTHSLVYPLRERPSHEKFAVRLAFAADGRCLQHVSATKLPPDDTGRNVRVGKNRRGRRTSDFLAHHSSLVKAGIGYSSPVYGSYVLE